MSRESLVAFAGFILILIPWLGVPTEWKHYAVSGLGALIFLIGILLRRAAYLRRIELSPGERGTDAFTESEPAEMEAQYFDTDTPDARQ